MTNPVNNFGPGLVGNTGALAGSKTSGPKSGVGSFSDTFNGYLDEVNKLQADASTAMQDHVTGKSDDLDGVMVAMEKSDLAFKSLMAIRTKLLDAYEELKNMPI